jgi:hypothetical protein
VTSIGALLIGPPDAVQSSSHNGRLRPSPPKEMKEAPAPRRGSDPFGAFGAIAAGAGSVSRSEVIAAICDRIVPHRSARLVLRPPRSHLHVRCAVDAA